MIRKTRLSLWLILLVLAPLAASPAGAAQSFDQTLLLRLDDPNPAERARAAKTLGDLRLSPDKAVDKLARLLGDGDFEVRRAALYALGRYGRASAKAVPAMFDRMLEEGGDLKNAAAFALHRVGPAASDYAKSMLASPDPLNRRAAVRVLALQGPAAVAHIEALTAALIDKGNQSFSLEIAAALAAVGSPAAPPLARLLAAPDVHTWSTAAHALVNLGPSAIPPLIDLAENPQAKARPQAVYALRTLAIQTTAPEGRAARAVLTRLVADPDPQVRFTAVSALMRIGAVDERIANVLPTALNDPSPTVRLHAVKALGETGDKAAPILPKLEPFFNDENPVLRRAALLAAAFIAPGEARFSRIAAKEFDSPNTEDRVAALAAVGAMGKAATPVLDDVKKTLADPDPQVRIQAVYSFFVIADTTDFVQTLKKLPPDADPAVLETIERLLKDVEPLVREKSASGA